jgi:signal transduction histidine kinase
MLPRILIVDDDENNRAVLADTLADEPYELEQAVDGEETLRIVERNAPDVILLDVLMPGMDGVECCRRLKEDERTAHIPVIIVTALDQDEHVVRGLTAGAIDYIAKPFTGPVARARIRAALRSKLAQDELRIRNNEVRQLATAVEQKNRKLASLTETAHRFVDNVAHEFRTPLAVIKEFAAIIADGLGGPTTAQQQEYLRFVDCATRELAQMVDDFLDSSKLKAGTLRVDRKRCRIQTVFDSVRPILLTRAKQKGIEIEEKIDPATPEFFADEEKVSRVLLNLGVNAIKFSPAGSVIGLMAAPDADVCTRVGVVDQGPGLCKEDLDRVFDRFKQVGDVERASTKGFGLGLNIAKELIWLNLGSVHVESTVGVGSTFSFTLPPCAPGAIVSRYFDRWRELDESPEQLVVLRARPAAPFDDLEPLRQFLVSICYPMDLILPDADASSLVLLGSTVEPQRWIERVMRQHDENLRKPDRQVVVAGGIDLRVEGMWPFSSTDACDIVEALVANELRSHAHA